MAEADSVGHNNGSSSAKSVDTMRQEKAQLGSKNDDGGSRSEV
jgi:hypothetical protein